MPSSLELGIFLEELATSSSFGDKTISLLMFTDLYSNHRVRAVPCRAVTACHALRSRAGLQGFRSEIGYQIFDQVGNRAGKITDFGLK